MASSAQAMAVSEATSLAMPVSVSARTPSSSQEAAYRR